MVCYFRNKSESILQNENNTILKGRERERERESSTPVKRSGTKHIEHTKIKSVIRKKYTNTHEKNNNNNVQEEKTLYWHLF